MTAHRWLGLGLALLPAAAALLLERLRHRRREARAYLRGVRHALAEDPDAALAALLDAARLARPEALDTHLALGALLRRAGDLARAIRLHRGLLARPGLAPLPRAEVERELADDYRRGGMLEEARAAYAVLAAAGDRAACERLRDVLVDLGRPGDAAAAQRALAGAGPDPLLAHLLAAHAREALAGDPAAAAARARQAVAADPRCADAHLALAEALGAAGEGGGARAALSAALDAEPRAALLAGPAAAALGAEAALALVAARRAAAPADAGLAWLEARLHLSAGRDREANAALRAALEADATGEATLAVRELLRQAGPPPATELADRHAILVAALRHPARPARCGRCGAELPTPAWRCPRCGALDPWDRPVPSGLAPVGVR